MSTSAHSLDLTATSHRAGYGIVGSSSAAVGWIVLFGLVLGVVFSQLARREQR